MSKAVLISIRPKWCEMIASGEKSIEVRKTRPKIETPFKCYIYCTNSGRPLVYGDKPCADGWTEAYTQTYGYSREEADKIWGVMNGKVIGEFVCSGIFDIMVSISNPDELSPYLFPFVGLTDKEIMEYVGNGKTGYGWHISELKIYDKPKELSDFRLYNTSTVIEYGLPMPTHEIRRPPQSYCYVEELT